MRAWLQRGWLACLLWPLSKLFQLVVGFRFGLFMLGYKARTRLPVPVVVVGNTFVGGTGKTPLTVWLVQQLRQAGRKPGVVSRGYGAAADTVREVQAGTTTAEAGDEPVLIAQRAQCPVFVGRNRAAAAQALLKAHPDTDLIIADDGLQHYALARDVEIVLFDQRGTGNGWMLPAGPLREPAQRRSDFTLINGADGAPGVAGDVLRMDLAPGEPYRLGQPDERISWEGLRERQSQGGKLAAAAGIGNPARFFATLRAQGLAFEGLPLPDHYDFADYPFANVQAELILITEKDAVKCGQLDAYRQDSRVWVVPVSAQLDANFATKILEKISEKQNGRTLA
jgi:tetraacyldisaccharide 4'-kinase